LTQVNSFNTFATMAMTESLQRIEAAMERLARVGRSRRSSARRAARAGLSLSGGAQEVLRAVLHHAPVRISDLARATHMSDAVVSRQVTQLEAEGLVVREACADDGRVARVRPTAAGRRASTRLRAAADEIFQEHLKAWRARDLELLARLMERLGDDLIGEVDRVP
jgi:DNA-binding MarR family transcriptional regulator